MPSAPDIFDDFIALFNIHGVNKGLTERYNLSASGWDQAVEQCTYLAKWRAAVLGRGATLQYAMVSRTGTPRSSKVAIEYPILGTTGVKFVYDGAVERDAKINSMASGVRIRCENVRGDHTVRLFRAVSDVYINEQKWVPGDATDKFDLGTYKDPVDLVEDLPASTELFNFTTPQTGAPLAAMRTYSSAWQFFLAGLFQFTNMKVYIKDSNGKRASISGTYPWESLVYRGISDREAGLPSLR